MFVESFPRLAWEPARRLDWASVDWLGAEVVDKFENFEIRGNIIFYYLNHLLKIEI